MFGCFFVSSNLRSDIVKDLSENRFLRWTVCNFARETPLKESGARNARCQKICGDMGRYEIHLEGIERGVWDIQTYQRPLSSARN